MKIKKLIEKVTYSINPPCPKCPYTLGFVKFVVSPCPECKSNNYQTFHVLTDAKRLNRGDNK